MAEPENHFVLNGRSCRFATEGETMSIRAHTSLSDDDLPVIHHVADLQLGVEPLIVDVETGRIIGQIRPYSC